MHMQVWENNILLSVSNLIGIATKGKLTNTIFRGDSQCAINKQAIL